MIELELEFELGKNQQKLMFDYNKEQNKVRGIFCLGSRNLGKIEEIYKGEQLSSINQKSLLNKAPLINSINPPLFKNSTLCTQSYQFFPDLDISVIQTKPASTKDFYDSLQNQKLFQEPDFNYKRNQPPSLQTKLLQFEKQKLFFKQKTPTMEKDQVFNVPNFFMKIQPYLENVKLDQKKNYKRETLNIKEELEDIYKGKFKIPRKKADQQN